MKKTLMTVIMLSISEVMETMFFLPVEEGETKPLSALGSKDLIDFGCTALSFSGEKISGRLVMGVSKTLLTEMTENFMGELEDNLKPEHLTGTLKEMLNMVCGNALRKLDAKDLFELGIPEEFSIADLPDDLGITMIETSKAQMFVSVEH